MSPSMFTNESARREATPVELAWRVHEALEGWVAKVDVKASILLAFQGGAFVFSAPMRQARATEDPRALAMALVGLSILVIAMSLAAMAILPALGSVRRHRAEYGNEWIYFGHVRLWAATELASRLALLSERDQMAALSAQMVRLSRLNWRKHRLLQVSVLLTLLHMVAMIVGMTLSAGS